MRASLSFQNAHSFLRTLSPSSFARGSGRGRKRRTHARRSLSPHSLSQMEKEFCRDLLPKLAHLLVGIVVALQPITIVGQRESQPARNATVTINFNPGHPANRFTPAHALGAAVDGHDKGTIDLQLTAPNI